MITSLYGFLDECVHTRDVHKLIFDLQPAFLFAVRLQTAMTDTGNSQHCSC